MKKGKKLTVIGFLLSVVCWSVYAETVTNNLDVQGGFIYNHGAINPGDIGMTFTNEGIRDITVSAGQLSGVDPETGEVITNAANLLSLKAESLTVVSNIVAGGTFVGNGSGLTNLNVESFSGTISASSLPTSGVWNASGVAVTLQDVIAELSTMTNLTLNSEALATVISNLQQQVNEVYVTQSSVAVQVTDNEVTNGLNLIAAYAEAKTMSPSATNRIAVIVPPGRYDLSTAGLQMDTAHIDLIGLTSDRAAQVLYGNPGTSNGVIKQTADYVRIENLTLNTKSEDTNWSDSNPAAYFPTVSGSNTVVRNCEFTGNSSMRYCVEYAGCYERCVAGDCSFGLLGPASGTFIGCQAGNTSFGFLDTASGTFTDCQAEEWSFGDNGVASGTFIGCQAGWESFGSYGPASGTFIGCQAGNTSFGFFGTANGTFTDCQAEEWSFGGGFGTASGTFTDCQAGWESFGGGEEATLTTNAVLINCSAGANSFGSFSMAATNFNYNTDGHIFAGGPIIGDGSGLTNLNVVTTESDPVFTNWLAVTEVVTGEVVRTESDPVFTSSIAAEISSNDVAEWNETHVVSTNNEADIALMTTDIGTLTDDVADHTSRITNLESQTNSYLSATAATNTFSGELIAQTNLTVQGAFTALYVPCQGDLGMGSFTNGLPQ